MKRLSRTAWIVLGAGIFVIAFAALYMLYSQQGREQQRLESEIGLAQATTSRVDSEKKDWESQLIKFQGELAQVESELSLAKSRLSRSQASLPSSVESIEYGERLFLIADGWMLKITSLTSSEPSDEEATDITLTVTSFRVTVNGQVDDILGFVNTIAADPNFTNATVKLVDMNVPEPLTDEEKEELTPEEIDERETPSAIITLAIYSY